MVPSMQMQGKEDVSVQLLKNYDLGPSVRFLDSIPKSITKQLFIETEAQRLKSDYL